MSSDARCGYSEQRSSSLYPVVVSSSIYLLTYLITGDSETTTTTTLRTVYGVFHLIRRLHRNKKKKKTKKRLFFATTQSFETFSRLFVVQRMSRGGGVFIAAAAVAASVVEGSFAGAGAVGDGRGQSACVLPGHTSYPFCNTSLSVDERVTDLIGRIRDEDKPNLLTARGCRNCNKEEAKVSLKTPGQQQALPYVFALRSELSGCGPH